MDLRGRLHVTGLIDRSIVEDAWRHAIARMTAAVYGRAYTNLSGRLVRVRTGRLRGSLRQRLEARASGLPAGVVGTEHPSFGPVFEGGARPHEITSSRGRLMRFRTEGGWVSTRRVQHPGLAPRRWLATAVDESQADFNRILLEEFTAATQRQQAGRLRRTA